MAPIETAYAVPSFVRAMQDRALRGHPREAYLWLYMRLDFVEYRPVKHAIVDRDLGIGDVAVKRAIDRLVECGYIARGDRVGSTGRLFTYRLTHSVAQSAG